MVTIERDLEALLLEVILNPSADIRIPFEALRRMEQMEYAKIKELYSAVRKRALNVALQSSNLSIEDCARRVDALFSEKAVLLARLDYTNLPPSAFFQEESDRDTTLKQHLIREMVDYVKENGGENRSIKLSLDESVFLSPFESCSKCGRMMSGRWLTNIHLLEDDTPRIRVSRAMKNGQEENLYPEELTLSELKHVLYDYIKNSLNVKKQYVIPVPSEVGAMYRILEKKLNVRIEEEADASLCQDAVTRAKLIEGKIHAWFDAESGTVHVVSSNSTLEQLKSNVICAILAKSGIERLFAKKEELDSFYNEIGYYNGVEHGRDLFGLLCYGSDNDLRWNNVASVLNDILGLSIRDLEKFSRSLYYNANYHERSVYKKNIEEGNIEALEKRFRYFMEDRTDGRNIFTLGKKGEAYLRAGFEEGVLLISRKLFENLQERECDAFETLKQKDIVNSILNPIGIVKVSERETGRENIVIITDIEVSKDKFFVLSIPAIGYNQSNINDNKIKGFRLMYYNQIITLLNNDNGRNILYLAKKNTGNGFKLVDTFMHKELRPYQRKVLDFIDINFKNRMLASEKAALIKELGLSMQKKSEVDGHQGTFTPELHRQPLKNHSANIENVTDKYNNISNKNEDLTQIVDKKAGLTAARGIFTPNSSCQPLKSNYANIETDSEENNNSAQTIHNNYRKREPIAVSKKYFTEKMLAKLATHGIENDIDLLVMGRERCSNAFSHLLYKHIVEFLEDIGHPFPPLDALDTTMEIEGVTDLLEKRKLQEYFRQVSSLPGRFPGDFKFCVPYDIMGKSFEGMNAAVLAAAGYNNAHAWNGCPFFVDKTQIKALGLHVNEGVNPLRVTLDADSRQSMYFNLMDTDFDKLYPSEWENIMKIEPIECPENVIRLLFMLKTPSIVDSVNPFRRYSQRFSQQLPQTVNTSIVEAMQIAAFLVDCHIKKGQGF